MEWKEQVIWLKILIQKKKDYPLNLHEVRSKEELLSLIVWVKFVEKEREEFMKIKQQYGLHSGNSSNNNINKVALNNKNNLKIYHL